MTYAHDPGAKAWMGRPGAEVFSEAAERGGAVFNAGLRLWQDQTTRYVEELAAQGRQTLGRLVECRTPLDVLSVEQDWVRARTRFYLESGLRFADAVTAAAREADESGAERAAPAAKPRKG